MSNKNAVAALTEQRRLLQVEYADEKKAFAELTDRIGVVRLVARGRAWTPLRFGNSYYNSLNQRVVEVFRELDNDDPETADDHEFEYGRPVVFFTQDPVTGAVSRRAAGTVSFVDGQRMVVAIADGVDVGALAALPRVGVMLSFDETTYRAMFEAIDRTIAADGRLGQLSDLLYTPTVKAGELTFSPLRFPYLNASQQDAVNKVMRAKDVAVVHGPPGTGKTTTLVEAIYETLRRESQVLVCAQSNMAVDWISEKLMERGINVLRIGNPHRINDVMLSSSYERRFESHPDYPLLWQIRKAIRELHGTRRRGTEAWHQKMDRLKSRAADLEFRINSAVFDEARVIACTLVGSSSKLLDGRKFGTLFIDEAAQALQGAALIPLRRAGRIVLAGDHCQLPPTVKSLEAMKGGLARSLMEVIVDNHPEAVTLLTEQYRMRQEIMDFPNRWFYHGAMTAADEVRWRSIIDYDSPVEWIDTADYTNADGDEGDVDEFREAVGGAGFGRVNPAEARLSLQVLEAYITRIGAERMLAESVTIGLISPYRTQVQYLRRLIRQNKFFKPFRRFITINTVDGFQGQERDVIAVSMVRNNADGQIGFLRDLRRMNVAMTRARVKLIIIGDAATLTRHPFYRALHETLD